MHVEEDYIQMQCENVTGRIINQSNGAIDDIILSLVDNSSYYRQCKMFNVKFCFIKQNDLSLLIVINSIYVCM